MLCIVCLLTVLGGHDAQSMRVKRSDPKILDILLTLAAIPLWKPQEMPRALNPSIQSQARTVGMYLVF